jgi:hypothetical protein
LKASVWNRVRAKLKKKFLAAGITFCEMCGRHDYLSFAHRYKRRFITDETELEMVALLCMDGPDWKGCHNKLEHSPHETMYKTITEIINGRNVTQ